MGIDEISQQIAKEIHQADMTLWHASIKKTSLAGVAVFPEGFLAQEAESSPALQDAFSGLQDLPVPDVANQDVFKFWGATVYAALLCQEHWHATLGFTQGYAGLLWVRKLRLELLRETVCALVQWSLTRGLPVRFFNELFVFEDKSAQNKLNSLTALLFVPSTDLPYHLQWKLYHWLCLLANQFSEHKINNMLLYFLQKRIDGEAFNERLIKRCSLTPSTLIFCDTIDAWECCLNHEQRQKYGDTTLSLVGDENGYRKQSDDSVSEQYDALGEMVEFLCLSYRNGREQAHDLLDELGDVDFFSGYDFLIRSTSDDMVKSGGGV